MQHKTVQNTLAQTLKNLLNTHCYHPVSLRLNQVYGLVIQDVGEFPLAYRHFASLNQIASLLYHFELD